MCKCLSDFELPELSSKCYIDWLHFVCILANQIGETKEQSRHVGFRTRIK